MKGWYGHLDNDFPFELFSVSHLVMIGILITGGVLLAVFRNDIENRSGIVRFVFFLLLLGLEAMYHYWMYKDRLWNATFMLPFHLCSISLVLCLLLLITKWELVFQVVYFIGIIGALMAIVTPELFFGYPHFRYFHFFVTHILIISTCLYFVLVHQYKPTKKGLFLSFAFLNSCAGLAWMVNKYTGGNYMFLASKPANGSLFDYLGPYPYYVLVLEVVALLLFLALLIPFRWKRGQQRRKGAL
ncbi:TIGR02206 family membrane protein [Niallia circulans]|uniref:TIGR02206 family membrane protein n=1 Tax=Niallia circulans TaxID=1397 RepID=A0A941GGL1_NIACI|nr:TIGR02206 family membrane protein [Niallia circulans]MCB5237780.1 TIGR02206 family membrane protein [Niallia circulans]